MKILVLISIVITIISVVQGKRTRPRQNTQRLCIQRTATVINRGRGIGGGQIAQVYNNWLNDKKGQIVGGIEGVTTNLGLTSRTLFNDDTQGINHRIDLQTNTNDEARIAFQVGTTVQAQAHLRYGTYNNLPAGRQPPLADKIAKSVYSALLLSARDGYIYSVELQQRIQPAKHRGAGQWPAGNCVNNVPPA